MPYDHCPPSRRGHAWRELTLADQHGPKLTRTALKAMLTLRLCARCGTLGHVSNQGVVHVMEGTTTHATPAKKDSP